ncbi:NAD(P)-dependent oxidoreductase [uncultured Megasphaera sp.]|uniref:NAD(P)-dependent oxidoreductase n=1 Tax=uncultured Megasphaera sp. TaxID=165188 RepID=UPI0025D6EF39|nr:NAD(P)-dependent oxidoreductase [uncultured Megasphaera sp.]
MSDMKNPLASFHEEPLHDTDYTLAEVVAEARRCLNCKVPQCRKGCPIENDIPTFIHAVTEGDFGMAAEIVYNHSDLPAICGRVCPREKQCEGHCVLGKKGKHVEIGKIERFIADIAFEGAFLPNSVSKKTAGRVAVIGCGPAGMAAARELAKLDYDVTIFEAASQPGGTMTYGIPTFRLHKELLQREAKALTDMGVTIEYNVKIGIDKPFAELQQKFDAVFIAIGTMNAWNLGVDNDTLDGVVDAEQFLRDVQRVQCGEVALEDLPVKKGDQVIVVGAGNVAIDAARTSLRLGADVKIVYRRAEKNMKCLPSEYEEAKADGVQFQFYSAPKAVVGTDHVEGLKYEKQQILEDATMVPTGEFGVVPANKIIAAIGNKPELPVVKALGVDANDDGYIAVKEMPYGMTCKEGIFAAGDIVHKPQTVVLAMREGRRTAAGIDQYLKARRIMAAAQAKA